MALLNHSPSDVMSLMASKHRSSSGGCPLASGAGDFAPKTHTLRDRFCPSATGFWFSLLRKFRKKERKKEDPHFHVLIYIFKIRPWALELEMTKTKKTAYK